MRLPLIRTNTPRIIIIVLALVALLPAAPQASHASNGYGIMNGSFDRNGICTLAGWSHNGARTMTDGQNCYASISARVVDVVGASPITVTSYLSQTFTVDPGDPSLVFYLKPASDYPNTAYPAQTVSLYDSAGRLIYQKSRNINPTCGYLFSQSLQGYGGQRVRLQISVTSSTGPNAPSVSSLKVDFNADHWGCPPPDPDGAPITGW